MVLYSFSDERNYFITCIRIIVPGTDAYLNSREQRTRKRVCSQFKTKKLRSNLKLKIKSQSEIVLVIHKKAPDLGAFIILKYFVFKKR
jgi:hypothetical protein